MGAFYKEGETKTRPGVYQRHSSERETVSAGAIDGICAVAISAPWGPVGIVTKHTSSKSIYRTYGTGDGVSAAIMTLEGGANTVYIARVGGNDGAKGTVTLKDNGETPADLITVTAKYEGEYPIKVAVKAKIGDNTQKTFMVIIDAEVLETYTFAAGSGVDEAENLITAVGSKSQYVELKKSAGSTSTNVVAEAEVVLDGGVNPAATKDKYLDAFYTLEPYRYNVLATDSIDMGVAGILYEYIKEAQQSGKLIMGSVGEPVTVEFEARKAHTRTFNDPAINYFGSGYYNAAGERIEGALGACYTAGLIASTPSNSGIAHTEISEAVSLIENLTNAQYEEAIQNGMLLLSASPTSTIWYDSAVNSLTALTDNQDEGWKKIRRVKTRYEAMDRIDRTLAPIVGKINCDTNGIFNVIQLANGVLQAMVGEMKISSFNFYADPENPAAGDSAWFIIELDDIDSLEKVYLHYKFRYSVNA